MRARIFSGSYDPPPGRIVFRRFAWRGWVPAVGEEEVVSG